MANEEIEISFEGLNPDDKGVYSDVIQGCSIRLQRPIKSGDKYEVDCDIHGHLLTTDEEYTAIKEIGFHQGFESAKHCFNIKE